jgi:hypothetical protein
MSKLLGNTVTYDYVDVFGGYVRPVDYVIKAIYDGKDLAEYLKCTYKECFKCEPEGISFKALAEQVIRDVNLRAEEAGEAATTYVIKYYVKSFPDESLKGPDVAKVWLKMANKYSK